MPPGPFVGTNFTAGALKSKPLLKPLGGMSPPAVGLGRPAAGLLAAAGRA
jgi:hypothetical protein